MVVMAMPALYSCKKGFQDLNIDPINIVSTTPNKLLAPALVNSIWPGMNRNRTFTGELMQVTLNELIEDGGSLPSLHSFVSQRGLAYLLPNWQAPCFRL